MVLQSIGLLLLGDYQSSIRYLEMYLMFIERICTGTNPSEMKLLSSRTCLATWLRIILKRIKLLAANEREAAQGKLFTLKK